MIERSYDKGKLTIGKQVWEFDCPSALSAQGSTVVKQITLSYNEKLANAFVISWGWEPKEVAGNTHVLEKIKDLKKNKRITKKETNKLKQTYLKFGKEISEEGKLA